MTRTIEISDETFEKIKEGMDRLEDFCSKISK